MLKLMTVVLDCKDGQESQDSFKIRLSNETLEDIHVCYESFKRFLNPVIYVDKCVNFCKNFSITSSSEVFDGNLSKLNYVYQKLIASNLKYTDPIFNDVDNIIDYDFAKANPEFYENKLSF